MFINLVNIQFRSESKAFRTQTGYPVAKAVNEDALRVPTVAVTVAHSYISERIFDWRTRRRRPIADSQRNASIERKR